MPHRLHPNKVDKYAYPLKKTKNQREVQTNADHMEINVLPFSFADAFMK